MTYHRGKEKKGIIIKPLVCKYLPTRLYKMAISTTASPTSAPGMLLWSWTWPPYEQKWEKKNFCLTQRPLLVQSCNIRSVNIVRLNCDDLILPLKPQTHNHPTDESWGMCCYDAEMKMSSLIVIISLFSGPLAELCQVHLHDTDSLKRMLISFLHTDPDQYWKTKHCG